MQNKKNRGQQGVHSSAANEDSCEYSVKQIETSICVPVSLISLHRSSKRLSSEPQKDQVCSEFFFRSHFPSCFLSNIFTRRKKSMKIEEQNMKCSSMPFLYLGRYKRQGVWQHYGWRLAANGLGTIHSDRYYQSITTLREKKHGTNPFQVCVCVDDLRINFAHRNSGSVGLEPFQNMRSICAHKKYIQLCLSRDMISAFCVEWNGNFCKNMSLTRGSSLVKTQVFPNVRWKTWIIQAKHSEIQLLLEE